ncbi:hypothetical protein Lsai_2159 [Legionella sainthelensi]|uniref:Uncharacterized protein n=1 Tax=Legionella sainthelensi TaxID=28087 RepID=A0A0W0YGF4_9GAMM|nr:hypothetical protein Lsai_2159 [Legionella sainthelensi]
MPLMLQNGATSFICNSLRNSPASVLQKSQWSRIIPIAYKPNNYAPCKLLSIGSVVFLAELLVELRAKNSQ